MKSPLMLRLPWPGRWKAPLTGSLERLHYGAVLVNFREINLATSPIIGSFSNSLVLRQDSYGENL
jgi:hypothetical protein